MFILLVVIISTLILFFQSRITPTVLWRDYRRPSDVKNKSPITDSSPLFEPWNETWTDDRYQSKIRDLQHTVNSLTQEGRRNHAVPITIRGKQQHYLPHPFIPYLQVPISKSSVRAISCYVAGVPSSTRTNFQICNSTVCQSFNTTSWAMLPF